MKRKFTFLIAAMALMIAMIGSGAEAWGQASVGTTLWAETWTGGTTGEQPKDYGFEGTTVYNSGTVTYTNSSENTKLYDESSAGGTKPELLLSKSNQTWTISGIPTGGATGMSLTFLSNKATFAVTTTTTNITVSGSGKTWTISNTGNVATFNITIKNTGSSNARIDDINLVVTTAGGSGPSISCSDITDVPYEGVTDATATVTFTNATGWTPNITCDGTIVTSASLSESTVTYSVSENEGDEDRTGSFTITLSKSGETDVTKEVSVTQNHFVVDYATLPFNWAGGSSSAFNALPGVTTYSLGSDYSASYAPYLMKFDNTDDYIQVKTNESIGVVSISVKMAGGGNTSYITVKGSADGETFSDGEQLTISGKQNDIVNIQTSANLDPSHRYVRMVFTKGSNVGVGPISIAKYVQTYTANVALNNTSYGSLEGPTNNIYTVTPNSGYKISGYDKTENVTVEKLTGDEYSASTYRIIATAENQTVTFNLAQRETATITWHHGENGASTINTNGYVDGPIGTLQEADEVNGWFFKGWSRNNDVSGNIVYVQSSDIIGEATLNLYAVYQQGEETYDMIDNVEDLEIGKPYMIGSYDDYFLTSNLGKTNSNVLDENYSFTYVDGARLILGGDTDEYTLQNGDKYLGVNPDGYNLVNLDDATTNYAIWEITFDDDESAIASIYNVGKERYIEYYNGFTTYSTPNVYLYKQATTATYTTTPEADHSITITYKNLKNDPDDSEDTDYDIFPTGEGTVREAPELVGYIFNGWNSSIDGGGTSYEVGQTVTENKTIYAVWSENDNFKTITLTGDNMSDMTNAGTGYGNVKSITVDGNYWETNGYQTSTLKKMIQLRVRTNSNGVSYIKVPEIDGIICSITCSVTSSSATSMGGATTTAKLYFQLNDESDADIIAQAGGSATNEIALDLSNTAHSGGYITADGSLRIWNITLKYIKRTDFTGSTLSSIPEHVCISIPANSTVTATDNLTIPASSKMIVKAGSIFNMDEFTLTNDNAANLIIEDGGQLYLPSSASKSEVKATVEKDIAAAPAWGEGGGSLGWYTFGSPIATDTWEDFEGIFTEESGEDYDLYAYDEASYTWLNHKKSELDLTNGAGYLYASKMGTTIKFIGDIFNDEFCALPTNCESELEDLKGFNLVGNPYTHNITMDNIVTYGEEEGTLPGGYVLTNAGGWKSTLDTEIKPCEGFMIQIPEDVATVIAYNTVPDSKSRDSRSSININVRNSQYEDNAFAVFNEGFGLNKINHRNADIPMVYIPQNGNNYAIACMNENTTAFPVSFKAASTGKYTISLKANTEINQLILVDNMTGEETNMLLEDGYTFIGSPNDNADRFTVKLGLNHNAGYDDTDNFVYQNGNELIINGEGTLQIVDILGRVVVSKEIHGQTVNVENLAKGAYIVRMTGENVKTQKIVVK